MIVYSEHYVICLLLQFHGSVIPKALWYVIPSLALTIVLLWWKEWFPKDADAPDTSDITESVVWTSSTAATFVLVAFRLQQSHARFWEGTTLLHQMQGEWFESASCLMAFSAQAKATKPAEVNEFRQTLIRLFSFLHGSALEEIKKDDGVLYEVIDLQGLDKQTLKILYDSKESYGFNRVEVLLHMIQMLMTHNHHEKVLTIAPPILSRVYQTLSRGMVNFINAQKIADTMFPFPFAQLCMVAVVFHMLFTPFVVTAIITHKVWAMLATVVPLFGICCLNFTAEELEMPYGDDPNDLPLDHLQNKFNRALMMLLRDLADHVPQIEDRAVLDWPTLQGIYNDTSEHPVAFNCCATPCMKWRSRGAEPADAADAGDATPVREVKAILKKSDTKSLSTWAAERNSFRVEKERDGFGFDEDEARPGEVTKTLQDFTSRREGSGSALAAPESKRKQQPLDDFVADRAQGTPKTLGPR